MLGDGHLELADNKKSALLKIEQSKDKKDYIEHLWSIFQSWDPGKIKEAKHEKGINLAFSTKYSTSLLPYHQKFYKGKERVVPQGIDNEFTARSLTYLYMDDGGIKSKGVFINTYSLPEDDQKYFCDLINKKFNLQSKVVYHRGDPRIYISGYSYETFLLLLKPYLLPFFSYKIPPSRSTRSRFRFK